MANTGIERSLTLIVTKKMNDNIQTGYPVTYQGRNAFTHNSVSYPAITPFEMSILADTDYNARLAAFQAYIESIEVGLDIDTQTIEGGEAFRENLTVCPII